jgi:hypothetical protein
MGHWKGKLDDDEMTDAAPTLNGPGIRVVADIEAELERVAQLLSGLPTNVQPGMYASALEAHLSTVSGVLHLELEQKLKASGTTGTHHSLVPPAGAGLAARLLLTGSRLDIGLRGSSQVCAPRPRFPRKARGERNPQPQSTGPPPASPDSIHAGMHAMPDRGSHADFELHGTLPKPHRRSACSFAEHFHNLAD